VRVAPCQKRLCAAACIVWDRNGLKRTVRTCLIVAVLLITAHRLPAPIVEENPTPARERVAKSKPKRTAESKSSSSAAKPSATPAPLPTRRFAGTWVGTIPAFPTGPQETVLVVNADESTMTHTWVGNPPTRTVQAQINGGTIQATFPNGVATYTFSITPAPDGTTAHVRLQAFMNDNSATFYRRADSNAAKRTR
jgi:hypothetical protein